MTDEQFFESLKSICKDFKWELAGEHKCLRGSHEGITQWFCPITAVHYKKSSEILPTALYEQAGKKLNLEKDLVHRIVWAADSHRDPLRTRLLKACGLKRGVQ